MKRYTATEILRAAEIGEINMIDARHIVSLLDEARHGKKTTPCHCSKQYFINDQNGVKTCMYCGGIPKK
jgi:hypothetical protein